MDEQLSKRIKEISKEILMDFDAFCKEHHLEYHLSFGTLLGAVRHGGFIPWDDDIDVEMPIEDYIRFQKLWLKHGDKNKYFLQTKKTDHKIVCSFVRLRLNGTTWSEPGYEEYPIHWGLPLDVFPVYHAPKSEKLQKVQKKLFGLSNRFCQYDWTHKHAGRVASWIHRQLALVFLNGVYMVSYCCKSSPLVFFPYGYPGRDIGEKTWWHPSKPILFEGVELQAHPDPHTYLTWQYGEDYMTPPPENQRGGHDVGIIDLDHDSEYYTHCVKRNK